jgi:hypothetical protein
MGRNAKYTFFTPPRPPPRPRRHTLVDILVGDKSKFFFFHEVLVCVALQHLPARVTVLVVRITLTTCHHTD